MINTNGDLLTDSLLHPPLVVGVAQKPRHFFCKNSEKVNTRLTVGISCDLLYATCLPL